MAGQSSMHGQNSGASMAAGQHSGFQGMGGRSMGGGNSEIFKHCRHYAQQT